MFASESALDVVAVVAHVFHHFGAECFTSGFNSRVVIAHCLGREVGVRACAVPVSLLWLCCIRDDHVVIFCNTIEQPTRNMHVIAHRECACCTNLKLPLTWHYFSVCSFDHQTSIQTCLRVLFNDWTTNDTTCSDAAVVRALWSWLTGCFWETKWSAIHTHHRVFLLDAINHSVACIL